ncbi:hypothetical protein GCM10009715_21350 [Paeniglutamicibacter psychrophenolicus]|uniref:Nucleotidyltransferase n=1 Tax=Paeniglutamicibacter psychrophenolicus TaxID=257454 RepID=A0ABS4WH88_9MICC|nr:hypothetical protein [Paeniglutamicibacter psychrophenolicus]MBP2375571.1 hypothetical protein [Paeniglutamicibacter psychrophenolicus]
MLIETIGALAPHLDALTIVGAHAVHVWVQEMWGPIDMEATRDGDLVINPVFVAEEPKILELMASIGMEPALEDRPGIYGYGSERDMAWEQRTTIDLLVPAVYAGKKGRTAKIAGQDKATTQSYGLELAVHDRILTKLSTMDTQPSISAKAYVAGPAALLVAKAHKIHERLAELERHPDRLRPKDSGDVALLMMVTRGDEVAETMMMHARAHAEIREVVNEGADLLMGMYSAQNATIVREHMVDSLAARFREQDLLADVDTWLAAFCSRFRRVETN